MLVLRPSKIDELGVFTTSTIRRNEKLDLFHPSDWKFVRAPGGEEKKLCQRFGVRDGDGYHCPKYWNRMSLGWYLNDSANPNVEHRKCSFSVLRPIRAGEELTIDYDTL